MNKSINTFLADQNVIQSLEQQFDYLQCARVTLMSCWDLKEHHIIIIKPGFHLQQTPRPRHKRQSDYLVEQSSFPLIALFGLKIGRCRGRNWLNGNQALSIKIRKGKFQQNSHSTLSVYDN